MKKKKVLYIYAESPSEYAKYLYNLFVKIKKEIYINTAIYGKNNFSDIQLNSNSFLNKIQKIFFKLKLSRFKSVDIKRFYEFDIIHLQHSYLFPKLSDLLEFPKSKRPKVLITLRGGDTYIKPWINKKWSNFYKKDASKVDGFITMSEHQKQYLQKWGVPKNRIHVIPISFGEKSKTKPKMPSKNTIKIVSAYRMCWEKNIEGNLRVIMILKEKGYQIQYDIYGDGPDSGEVFYLIDKYKLENCVNYFGRIDNSILKENLRNYDFLLQLSHSESFGGVVVEAQSQGVPCIVSNSGGLPEAIMDGESGFCVDSYDVNLAVKCIIDLYFNDKVYTMFSKNAIKYVNNNFTLKNEAEKLLTLYETI